MDVARSSRRPLGSGVAFDVNVYTMALGAPSLTSPIKTPLAVPRPVNDTVRINSSVSKLNRLSVPCIANGAGVAAHIVRLNSSARQRRRVLRAARNARVAETNPDSE